MEEWATAMELNDSRGLTATTWIISHGTPVTDIYLGSGIGALVSRFLRRVVHDQRVPRRLMCVGAASGRRSGKKCVLFEMIDIDSTM